MKINLKQFLIAGITTLVFVFYFGLNNFVNSSSTDNVSGYAWNADGADSTHIGGMGWLSFNNCVSAGNCPAPAYGVTVDNAGNILGYAWAGNSIDSSVNGFGWIKFGGLSGIPSGPGTVSENAKLTNSKVTGWARACAVFQSGCLNPGDPTDYYHGTGAIDNNLATNPYLGGWDGWISLSGTGYGVTVNQSTGVFSGYAWGGSDVLGWIDFSRVVKGVSAASQLVFYADSTVVYPPSYQTTLRWSSSVPLTGCNATSNPTVNTANSWNGVVADPSSSKLVDVPANPIPVQYDLTCLDSSNNPVKASSVYVFRVESVMLSNTNVVNGTTTLSWATVNASSCTASGPAGSLWSGAKGDNGSQTGVIVTAVSPATGAYSITCVGLNSNSQITSTLNLNTISGAMSNRRQPKYSEH